MTAIQKNLYGLILAGGYSQRMGHDKALLVYHDKLQLVYAYELLSQYCEKVFISLRPDQQEQSPYNQFPQILDRTDLSVKGPLAGILTAMTQESTKSWLVLGCDLPFVDSTAIEALLKQRDTSKPATAFISSTDGLPEPLCAIWEKEFTPLIFQHVFQGVTCPRKTLIKSAVHLIPQTNPQWLSNINTQEEYVTAQTIFKAS